jgi:hypothetical protein
LIYRKGRFLQNQTRRRLNKVTIKAETSRQRQRQLPNVPNNGYALTPFTAFYSLLRLFSDLYFFIESLKIRDKRKCSKKKNLDQ